MAHRQRPAFLLASILHTCSAQDLPYLSRHKFLKDWVPILITSLLQQARAILKKLDSLREERVTVSPWSRGSCLVVPDVVSQES